MMTSQLALARSHHPLDTVEQVAAARDWLCERQGEDEISIEISGKWANYTVSFSWHEELEESYRRFRTEFAR